MTMDFDAENVDPATTAEAGGVDMSALEGGIKQPSGTAEETSAADGDLGKPVAEEDGGWRKVLSPKKNNRNAQAKSWTKQDSSTALGDGDPKYLPKPPPKASKLRPPKHHSTRSRGNKQNGNNGKYLPVKSSGYGRVTRSNSTALNSAGYSSDDCSVGSVGSTGSTSSARSASSGGVGRGALRNETNLLGCSNRRAAAKRMSFSAPSSPVSEKQDDFRSGARGRSRSRARDGGESDNGGGGPSSWAKRQKELQEQRMKRAIGRKLKRPVAGSVRRRSPALDEGGNTQSKKAAKTSVGVSPAKAASSQRRDQAQQEQKQESAEVPASPVVQLKQVANNLLSSFRSPAGSTPAVSFSAGMTAPRSYSKVVASGGTPPTIGRKLFDNKTRSMLAEYSNFDPKASAVSKIADQIFAPGTGIGDDEIRKILNTKQSSGVKQWELKKKLDVANDSIKHLKTKMNQLLRGKNRFVNGAVDAERTARAGWERALHTAKIMDEERSALKKNISQLEADNTSLSDGAKDMERDLGLSEEKVARLEEQIDPLREKLAAAEKAHTEASIALAVLEAKSEESAKQAEGWRAEIAAIEKSKQDAVKQAETEVAAEKEREMAELREECASLRTKMEAREEELCRLVGAGVGDSNAGGGGSHIDSVKNELDKLRSQKVELESKLASQGAELERAKTDSQTATDRATSKDRDMSELAKGLREVQQSGQAREEEANALRKAAEAKAAEMEHQNTELRHEISVLTHDKDLAAETIEVVKREIANSEEIIAKLKAEIAEMKSDMTSASSQAQMEKELRARAEQNVEEERRERIACSAQMVAMTQEHARVQAQLKEENVGLERRWREKVEVQRDSLDEKDEAILKSKQIISGLEAERDSLKEAMKDQKNMVNAKSAEDIGQLMGEINVLKERLKAEEQKSKFVSVAGAEKVAALEATIREGQAERRRMHNLIQELRGNVRVFARVRPFLPNDGVSDDAEPFVVPKSESSLKLKKSDDGQEYSFSFDRVFPPSVGQEAVFDEVSELVQSALDGYNVCLFSYGQTGSGKTHTMQGSGSGAMRGIIPRSIEQVGSYKTELERDGWQYEMRVSFCEIYNETIRDLLREKKEQELKHEVKINSEGRRYVSDLNMRELNPNDPDAVEDVMRQAAKHRSVAATDMNSVSSRSHSVFTLHLTATNIARRETLQGALNLVDLAGSERLERSGATGARAKEAVSINKSLSALTSVFVSLGKKAGHIPFRDSKLTYLLQPCLSGDGKTLMICNVSPTEMSSQESLCSLRFASQVNKCELGVAKKQVTETGDSSAKPAKRTLGALGASARSKVKQRLR
uniref:Kinesin motor domain-containing protein n=1 Tax=Odontella aurita TaxID=265563 RepID=A0A7S4JBW0_9STRA|mmetsp:Transcript_43319/g.131799  ORF Transcript_43319/g.131799 Transcript_43319/m.131799 type:complete len:1325 (+) Transcript_43319:137-4111(+)